MAKAASPGMAAGFAAMRTGGRRACWRAGSRGIVRAPAARSSHGWQPRAVRAGAEAELGVEPPRVRRVRRAADALRSVGELQQRAFDDGGEAEDPGRRGEDRRPGERVALPPTSRG